MRRILLSILCLWSLGATAQDIRRPFGYTPESPLAGESVTISYDNSLTGLAGNTTVTGVIYLCDGNGWRVDNLDMSMQNGMWSGRYILPEDCVLMACKFYGEDGQWDSGPLAGQYGVMVGKLVDGKPITQKGALFHWGLLRSKSLDMYAVPDFCSDSAKIEDNVMQMWIGNEYRAYPESVEQMAYFAAKLIDKASPGEYNHLFQQDIDYIMGLGWPAEISLIRVADTYRNVMKDEARSREVEEMILRRFPDGILARDRMIWDIYIERDQDKKLAMLEQMIERFPREKFPVPQTDISRNFYARIFWASTYNRIMEKGDYEFLHRILPLVPYSALPEYYYRVVQLQLKHGLMTYEEIRPHADAIWAQFVRRAQEGEDRYYRSDRRYSPRQWAEEVRSSTRGYAVTHGQILYQTGAYAEGLELYESVKDYFKGEISEFNETYAKLLAANGYDQLVVPFIEQSVSLDAATPGMLADLEKDFRAKNPQGDFDAYVNGLRSEEHVAEFESKLLASLIDRDIEPFVLEGMDGKTVDMSTLKGKVIVLDFWATWCSPCKAAMPGMQMAVDRYKDNPDVVFYFIDTAESDKNYKTTVPKFINDNNYTFNVLYDAIDENGRQNVVYNKYRINGIPHKMIIDRDGKLRWSSNGYFGNPQELANEIGFIVDHLLAE